jgi:hypothetical protein
LGKAILNIFYLSPDPKICAEMHLDKHVVKMIIEYAQLMSTAHRVLDGQEYFDKTSNGRNIKRWKLSDDIMENGLMKSTHINHPSAIWCRANKQNYTWLNRMWNYLLVEYTHRYGKVHACEKYKDFLYVCPKNISESEFYTPTPAMPEDCKIFNDSLSSYRKYYIEKKQHFAKWTKREIPSWFSEGLNKQYANL